jgi:hypothetical protein
LQNDLNAAHQHISELKSSETFKGNQLVETNLETFRTANGHGR